jgi:hypothetical protein
MNNNQQNYNQNQSQDAIWQQQMYQQQQWSQYGYYNQYQQTPQQPAYQVIIFLKKISLDLIKYFFSIQQTMHSLHRLLQHSQQQVIYLKLIRGAKNRQLLIQ